MEWLRVLRHLAMPAWRLRQALPRATLQAIEAAIGASERAHGGQICFAVETALDLVPLVRGQSARERALEVFAQLRVWDTEHNNGVLIYLLLAERAIEIVADRGLARQVAPAQWEALIAGMREAFRAGRFEEGLVQAVDAVDGLLRQHYPLQSGQTNPNELPDVADLR